jgi:hypothetical protein
MSILGKAVFVFGSNRQGRHGKGTAKLARRKHGAIYGQAEGLQGNSYAIITKELRKSKKKVTLKEIKAGVDKFLKFAKQHPEWTFNVSPIGCGLAGRTPKQIGPMFRKHSKNVVLPKEFVPYCRSLEDRFALAWRKRFPELPKPKRQHQFCEGRKWKWPKYKLAVEIQGGSFIFGGHNRGASQAKDFEKNNEAVRLGWRVLFFNAKMIDHVGTGKIYECVQLTAEVLCNAS